MSGDYDLGVCVRTISEQELKDILDKHGKWLRSEVGGERADLRSANLSSANLCYADLSSADLSYADLSYADLRYANLRSVNLLETKGMKYLPLQVANARYFITIFDDYVQWGCRKMTFDEVNKFKFKDCTTYWNENEFKLNKKIITEMIRYYRPEDKETPKRSERMRLGISIEHATFRLNAGVRSYGFTWLPGEEESGSSYPAQFLDTPYGDRYWVYSWLCFVVFIVRAMR